MLKEENKKEVKKRKEKKEAKREHESGEQSSKDLIPFFYCICNEALLTFLIIFMSKTTYIEVKDNNYTKVLWFILFNL